MLDPKHLRITLRALPGYSGDPAVRLRAFLKEVKRKYGFDCERFEEPTITPPTDDQKKEHTDVR